MKIERPFSHDNQITTIWFLHYLSVCNYVLSETKIWLTFLGVLSGFKGSEKWTSNGKQRVRPPVIRYVFAKLKNNFRKNEDKTELKKFDWKLVWANANLIAGGERVGYNHDDKSLFDRMKKDSLFADSESVAMSPKCREVDVQRRPFRTVTKSNFQTSPFFIRSKPEKL